jgi:hypothetical protein
MFFSDVRSMGKINGEKRKNSRKQEKVCRTSLPIFLLEEIEFLASASLAMGRSQRAIPSPTGSFDEEFKNLKRLNVALKKGKSWRRQRRAAFDAGLQPM